MDGQLPQNHVAPGDQDGDGEDEDGGDGEDPVDDDDDDDDDDDEGDDDGYPTHSHHDKIPPWWGNVSNDEGGNVSVSKTHHTP